MLVIIFSCLSRMDSIEEKKSSNNRSHKGTVDIGNSSLPELRDKEVSVYLINLIRSKDTKEKKSASIRELLKKEFPFKERNELVILRLAIGCLGNKQDINDMIADFWKRGIAVPNSIFSSKNTDQETLDMLIFLFDNIESEEISKQFPELIRLGSGLNINILNYIFDRITQNKKEQCLGGLIRNKKIPIQEKINLVKLLLNDDLKINEHVENNILSYSLVFLGNNKNIINKIWNKRIEYFDSRSFLLSATLVPDVVIFLFDRISQEKELECFKHLIKNDRILIQEKIEILEAILNEDLDIEEYKKFRFFGLFIEHLGNNKNIIKKIWNKGIQDLRSEYLSLPIKLSFDTVRFIFQKIEDSEKSEYFLNIIKNKKMLKKLKLKLVKFILNTTNISKVDLKIFKPILENAKKDKILQEALLYSGDEEEIIDVLWGTMSSDDIDYFTVFNESTGISLNVIDLLIEEKKDNFKMAIYFNYLIKNEKMTDDKKITLLDHILKRNDLDLKDFNEKKVLEEAIKHLGNSKNIIKKLLKIKILAESGYSNLEDWNKISKDKKIEDTNFCNSFFEAKRLSEDVVDEIFKKLDEKNKVDCLGNLIKNEKMVYDKKIGLIDHILNLERVELFIQKCNENKILEEALIYLGCKEYLIKKIWDKNIKISEFYNSFFKTKSLDIKTNNFIFSKIDGNQKAKCSKGLIKNEKMAYDKKIKLLDHILERNELDLKKFNEEKVLEEAIKYLGNSKNIIKKLLKIKILAESGYSNLEDWNKISKDKKIKDTNFCNSFFETKRLSKDVVDEIFEKLDVSQRAKCLKKLIKNEEKKLKNKEELIKHIILNITLNSEECKNEKVLDAAIEHLGNSDEIIKTIWEKIIKNGTPEIHNSFLETNGMSSKTMIFLFKKTTKQIEKVKCLGNIISNIKISNKDKKKLVGTILYEMKNHIYVLYKEMADEKILEKALVYLGDEEEIIKDISPGEIPDNIDSGFLRTRKLSEKVAKYIIGKAKKIEKKVDFFIKLIRNEEKELINKTDLVIAILETYSKTEGFIDERILEEALTHMGNYLEVIQRIYSFILANNDSSKIRSIINLHNIRYVKISDSFLSTKGIAPEVISFILPKIEEREVIKSVKDLILNKNINESKSKLVKAILESIEMKKWAKKFYKEGVLLTALIHCGKNIGIISPLIEKIINIANPSNIDSCFSVAFLETKGINTAVINYIFSKINEDNKKEKALCFKNIISNKEILQKGKVLLVKEMLGIEGNNMTEGLDAKECSRIEVLKAAETFLKDSEIIQELKDRGIDK